MARIASLGSVSPTLVPPLAGRWLEPRAGMRGDPCAHALRLWKSTSARLVGTWHLLGARPCALGRRHEVMKTCAVPGAQPPCQEGGREHQEHWTGANECTRCWRKGQRRGQSDSVGGCVSWKASWRMWPLRCVLMDEKVFDKQINGAKVSHHTNRLHSCGEHQK